MAIAHSVRAPAPAPVLRNLGSGWLYGFVATQFFCQILLLFPWFGAVRFACRIAAFSISLLLLLLLPGRSLAAHPVRGTVLVIFAIVGLGVLHPDTPGLLAASAQTAMYVAIAAPLFWVARLQVGTKGVEKLILFLWAFYSASAFVGVLQAFFPGYLEPSLSTVFAGRSKEYLASLEIQLVNGQRILRPMGLTDVPGGAAVGGFYAVLLGMGIFQQRDQRFWLRTLALGSMLTGMVTLYLCQVRALIVMLVICIIAMFSVLLLTGRVLGLMVSAGVVVAVVILGFTVAFSVGGNVVTDRLSSLVSDDLTNVYYTNRGKFLEHTLDNLLPLYPMGAGLGRWGMVNYYFGEGSALLWAEIQWTAWLYDGGILLIVVYALTALVVTGKAFSISVQLATQRDSALSHWAILIFSYNVGAIALTFSYPFFMSSAGLEFWLLNAALYQAYCLQIKTSSAPSIAAQGARAWSALRRPNPHLGLTSEQRTIQRNVL